MKIFRFIEKSENLYLLLIVFIALILRFFSLENIPCRVDGDASKFALDGMSYLQSNPPIWGIGWMGHANAYFYLVGYILKLFKSDLLGLRILSATGGLLSVLATYLFIRKLFNNTIAFWSGLFLAVAPFHLVFSRTGTEAVWSAFFAPIVLFLILYNKKAWFFLAGFLTGIAQYFYPASRIIPLYTFLLLFFQMFHKKISWKKGVQKILFYILGIFISYGPMMLYFINHPGDYLVRIRIVSIFGSTGWLEEALRSNKLISLFLEQVYKDFFVFFLPVDGAPMWFFRTPYLDFVAIFFFIIGLFMGIKNFRTWQIRFLYTYLVLGIFLAGVLTINSPMPSRYVILFPAIAGFVGVGVNAILIIFKKKRKKVLATIIIIVSLVSSGLYSYITHEQVDTWKYDTNTQIATYAGRYIANLPEESQIYFLGNSNMYYQAVPTLEFLTRQKGVDVFESLLNKPAHFPRKSIFIILPYRKQELPILQKQHAEEKYKEFRNPRGELLFYLFEN